MNNTQRIMMSSKKKPDRYNSIDKLKMFCAFLVVCIHAPFPGEIGTYLVSLARIAVPVFFMITGYFYVQASASRQIKKLLLLMLSANLIFFVWKSGLSIINGNIMEYWVDTFTFSNIAKFLLLNETHLQSHLWYLGAILYVILLVFVLFKWNENKAKRLLLVITPFLLAGDLILGKYSLLLFHREFPYILVRNWLFVGLPYFSIGIWMHEKKNVFSKFLKNKGKMKLAFFNILAVLTTLSERSILVSLNLNAARDHYISTTFLAIAVFLFFATYISQKKNIISHIGKKDSTWIYILHPIFITIIAFLVKCIAMEGIYCYIQPIIVFLVTTVFVEMLNCVINKMNAKRKSKTRKARSV